MIQFERQIRAAQGYHELGMHSDALRELQSLPREYQQRPEVIEMRLLILMRASRWKEALAEGRRLCRIAPDAAAGYIHTAYCLHELGDTAEARRILTEGPPALQREATFHYNLACYECALGDLNSAREHLQTSFGIDKSFRDFAKTDPDLGPLRDELSS